REPPRAVAQAFRAMPRTGFEQPSLEAGGIRIDASFEMRTGLERIKALDNRATRFRERFGAAIDRIHGLVHGYGSPREPSPLTAPSSRQLRHRHAGLRAYATGRRTRPGLRAAHPAIARAPARRAPRVRACRKRCRYGARCG